MDYRIERRLGRGGMAETFVATRRFATGPSRTVCLKRMLPELALDAALRADFEREARIASNLRHANIVLALDHGVVDGSAFLAMEWVDGVDLRGLLRSTRTAGSPLPCNVVALLASDLAHALEFAHACDRRGETRGVLHRDISPSNVLLGREGEVKLADFGIAKLAGESHHTRTGLLRGKVPYMAPEYVSGGAYVRSCDLFALGVTLYECLAGERPFDGSNEADTLGRIARGEGRPLPEWVHADSPVLARVVESLIERDPSARPDGARALIEQLAPAAPPATTRAALAAAVRELADARAMQSARSLWESTPTLVEPASDAGAVDATVNVAAADAVTRTRLPR